MAMSLSPYFSIFLLTLTFCVCPQLCPQPFTNKYTSLSLNNEVNNEAKVSQEPTSLCESNFQVKFQEKSDNVLIKQAKCIDSSNFFPDGGSGILNADLNRWCNGNSIHG